MAYRTRAATTFAAADRERALRTMREVLAYLRGQHPEVELRCFVEDYGGRVELVLYQDAASVEALLQVRETTGNDPAFLAIAAAIANAIVAASSQSYPTEEFEPS